MARIQWTKEAVFEEAKKYCSRSEFVNGNKNAYMVAWTNKWLDEMVWFKPTNRRSNRKWTKEVVLEEAGKYSSRYDFQKGYYTAYKYALNNGWLDEMPWLIPTRRNWTMENVFEESRKYNSRREFEDGCASAYGKALANGWLNEMPWLVIQRKTYTKEEAFKEAKKYTSRNAFRKGCCGAFDTSVRNGWIDDMFWLEHNKSWTKEDVFEESKKYATRREFQVGCQSAYGKALSNGWFDEMPWLPSTKKTWTKENVFEESKKYNSRIAFKTGCQMAYVIANRNKWLDEMFWLKLCEKYDRNGYCIYVYLDEENKVGYVGLTKNKAQRHKAHSTPFDYDGHPSKSSVYKYFESIGKRTPAPLYVEENLTAEQARAREDYWLQQYIYNGYTMLNKGKTGSKCGSLGMYSRRWTKNRVFEESKKYKSGGEFKIKCQRAYYIACTNGWIKDMIWLKIKHKPYTKEDVEMVVHKYSSLADFRKNEKGAYRVARKNGWIDEFIMG